MSGREDCGCMARKNRARLLPTVTGVEAGFDSQGDPRGHCGDRFHPAATAWPSVQNQASPFEASTTVLG